jgi:hypothetical protein
MSKYLRAIAKTVRQDYNPTKMTAKQLTLIGDLPKYIFEEVIPYTAKNGVKFYTNEVSLFGSHGFIRFSNSGSYGIKNDNGEEIYCLRLKYCPFYSTNIEYNLSCDIDSFDTDALEKISLKIKEADRKFGELLLK